MLNLFFALFLFGLLCALCFRGLYRAVKYRQSFTVNELALIIADFIGIIIALHMVFK